MTDGVRSLWDFPPPMHDGVKLPTDIYLPATEQAYPVIFSHMP